jgi:hypothetical protein
LQISLSLLAELTIIVGGQFLYASPVAVIILLKLVPQVSILVDQSGNLSFPFFAASLQSVVAFLNLMLLLLDFVGESLHFGLM